MPVKVFGLSIRRASDEKAYTVQDLAREVGWSLIGDGLDPGKVIREGYQENPVVGASIVKILMAASQVPWLAQEVTNDSGDVEDLDEDHPAARLLAYPMPLYGWDRIVEAAVGGLELFGEAYFYLNGPGNRVTETGSNLGPEPREVLWIPNSWVSRDSYGQDYRAADRPLRVNLPGGAPVDLPRHRVVQVCTWNPVSPFVGQSRLRPAARSVDQSNAAARWNVNLLRNSAQRPGAFSTPGKLDKETFNRLKAELREQYAGAGNAGNVPVLDGGLDFKATGMTAADMEWLEGAREADRKIATNLGLESYPGDYAAKTYANYSEARRALYEDTVLPFLNTIRNAFEIKLRQWWPELRLYLDTDEVPALAEAKQKQWEGLATLVEKGLISRNEARQRMGYKDVPGGDVILVPLALVPLEGAGEADELGGEEEEEVEEVPVDEEVPPVAP